MNGSDEYDFSGTSFNAFNAVFSDRLENIRTSDATHAPYDDDEEDDVIYNSDSAPHDIEARLREVNEAFNRDATPLTTDRPRRIKFNTRVRVRDISLRKISLEDSDTADDESESDRVDLEDLTVSISRTTPADVTVGENVQYVSTASSERAADGFESRSSQLHAQHPDIASTSTTQSFDSSLRQPGSTRGRAEQRGRRAVLGRVRSTDIESATASSSHDAAGPRPSTSTEENVVQNDQTNHMRNEKSNTPVLNRSKKLFFSDAQNSQSFPALIVVDSILEKNAKHADDEVIGKTDSVDLSSLTNVDETDTVMQKSPENICLKANDSNDDAEQLHDAVFPLSANAELDLRSQANAAQQQNSTNIRETKVAISGEDRLSEISNSKEKSRTYLSERFPDLSISSATKEHNEHSDSTNDQTKLKRHSSCEEGSCDRAIASSEDNTSILSCERQVTADSAVTGGGSGDTMSTLNSRSVCTQDEQDVSQQTIREPSVEVTEKPAGFACKKDQCGYGETTESPAIFAEVQGESNELLVNAQPISDTKEEQGETCSSYLDNKSVYSMDLQPNVSTDACASRNRRSDTTHRTLSGANGRSVWRHGSQMGSGAIPEQFQQRASRSRQTGRQLTVTRHQHSRQITTWSKSSATMPAEESASPAVTASETCTSETTVTVSLRLRGDSQVGRARAQQSAPSPTQDHLGRGSRHLSASSRAATRTNSSTSKSTSTSSTSQQCDEQELRRQQNDDAFRGWLQEKREQRRIERRNERIQRELGAAMLGKWHQQQFNAAAAQAQCVWTALVKAEPGDRRRPRARHRSLPPAALPLTSRVHNRIRDIYDPGHELRRPAQLHTPTFQ